MTNFYFDIETAGLNPRKDKIITIQYQKLDRTTGEPISELKILKEWESSEKEIIEKFLIDTKIIYDYPFNFIPVGYNLGFVNSFLKSRMDFHNLKSIYILTKPFIDLRAIGILMNKGEFKGSGLDQLTKKPKLSSNIPIWYENKEYEKIIFHIKNKTKEFIKFNYWLYKKLPLLLEEFNNTKM